MRSVGVVTVGRSDYGIYGPILRCLQDDADIRLQLFVAGAHLSPAFGFTVRDIEADGFEIVERIEMLLASSSPEGIARSMGLGTLGFAQAFARSRPDVLLVLGDRFEMHAAVVAAVPFLIPVAHIHGGEVTEGAIDDALRHSITKMSHLHFVSTQSHARRVAQMGEESWRIIVSGAPGLDNLRTLRLLGDDELVQRLGMDLTPPPLLVTFHPVTLEWHEAQPQVEELLSALDACGAPVVFTMPNADTNHDVIRRRVESYVKVRPNSRAFETLGAQAYFSLMARAAAMVGNSSSGLIEAASFELPVVNIGTRQAGRERGRNVLDVACAREQIGAAIFTAMSTAFRDSLRGMANPYGNGTAAQIIADRLKSVPLDDRLLRKRFRDLDFREPDFAACGGSP